MKHLLKKPLVGALFMFIAFNPQAKAQTWNLAGNTSTNPPTDFIGTTDFKALVFKTANLDRMTLTASGVLAIGTDPANTLCRLQVYNNAVDQHVNISGGAPAIQFANALDWNTSTARARFGLASAANQFATGNLNTDFIIQTLSTAGGLVFATTTNPATCTSRMRITADGKIGVNTSSPSDLLTVNDGNIALTQTTDATPRNINGTTSAGALILNAKTSSADGPAIQLYGNTSSKPGKISFISDGSGTDEAFNFVNYNTSTLAYQERMMITHDGKIGINTSSPSELLTVNDGNIALTSTSDASGRTIKGTTLTKSLIINANTTSADGPAIEMYGNSSDRPGRVSFVSNGSGTDVAFNFINYNPSTSIYQERMRITQDGKVQIGDNSVLTMPGSYDLYVQHGILTEKIKVAVCCDPSYWSDFVFNNDYQLMPLNDVASFIQDNKHLPDVPSTSDVMKDGLDLAQMDAKLLQKIEELTLYVIQLQKQSEKQQKEIEHLKEHK